MRIDRLDQSFKGGDKNADYVLLSTPIRLCRDPGLDWTSETAFRSS